MDANILNFRKPAIWMITAVLAIAVIVGVYLLAKSAFSQPKLELSAYDAANQNTDIQITINNRSISPSTRVISLVMENKSDSTFIYGIFSKLEILVDQAWYTIPVKKNVNWHMLAYPIDPHALAYKFFDLSYFYDRLKPGIYRLVEPVTDIGSQPAEDSFVVTVFTIAAATGQETESSISVQPSAVTVDEQTAEDFVNAKGYTIIERRGTVSRYVLEKYLFYHGNPGCEQFVYTWSVQTVEPDQYYGKTISLVGFRVGNHPSELRYAASGGVDLTIMLADGQVIGGFSLPHTDVPLFGGVDALDGRTREEITGLTNTAWRESWLKKYGYLNDRDTIFAAAYFVAIEYMINDTSIVRNHVNTFAIDTSHLPSIKPGDKAMLLDALTYDHRYALDKTYQDLKDQGFVSDLGELRNCIFIGLDHVKIIGSSVTLSASKISGPKAGFGLDLEITYVDGQWKITGKSGFWVS